MSIRRRVSAEDCERPCANSRPENWHGPDLHDQWAALRIPHRSLGELDTLLTPQVKKMVSHKIPKDLTGASPPDLWRALEKVLPTPVLA